MDFTPRWNASASSRFFCAASAWPKFKQDELDYLDNQFRTLQDQIQALKKQNEALARQLREYKRFKEVAQALNLAVSTVESHRKHIMEKLGLHSAAEIVLYAVRRGVIR